MQYPLFYEHQNETLRNEPIDSVFDRLYFSRTVQEGNSLLMVYRDVCFMAHVRDHNLNIDEEVVARGHI